MAKALMSTITNQILFASGNTGPRWATVTGVDIYPGSIVTMFGETIHTPSIDLPGAADEDTIGIVGLLPNKDIDEAYAAGDIVPVHEVGTEAVVFGHVKANDGNKKAGEVLQHDGATAANGFAIGGELRKEYVGEVYEDCTVDASDDTVCLIWLK